MRKLQLRNSCLSRRSQLRVHVVNPLHGAGSRGHARLLPSWHGHGSHILCSPEENDKNRPYYLD